MGAEGKKKPPFLFAPDKRMDATMTQSLSYNYGTQTLHRGGWLPGETCDAFVDRVLRFCGHPPKIIHVWPHNPFVLDDDVDDLRSGRRLWEFISTISLRANAPRELHIHNSALRPDRLIVWTPITSLQNLEISGRLIAGEKLPSQSFWQKLSAFLGKSLSNLTAPEFYEQSLSEALKGADVFPFLRRLEIHVGLHILRELAKFRPVIQFSVATDWDALERELLSSDILLARIYFASIQGNATVKQLENCRLQYASALTNLHLSVVPPRLLIYFPSTIEHLTIYEVSQASSLKFFEELEQLPKLVTLCLIGHVSQEILAFLPRLSVLTQLILQWAMKEDESSPLLLPCQLKSLVLGQPSYEVPQLKGVTSLQNLNVFSKGDGAEAILKNYPKLRSLELNLNNGELPQISRQIYVAENLVSLAVNTASIAPISLHSLDQISGCTDFSIEHDDGTVEPPWLSENRLLLQQRREKFTAIMCSYILSRRSQAVASSSRLVLLPADLFHLILRAYNSSWKELQLEQHSVESTFRRLLRM